MAPIVMRIRAPVRERESCRHDRAHTSFQRPGLRKDPGLFVFFTAQPPGCAPPPHRRQWTCSLTSCRDAAPVLAGSACRTFADVAQWKSATLPRSRPWFRSPPSAPLRVCPCGTAGARPRERRGGNVHGVAPHVQRGHLAGMPATRARAQPKWVHVVFVQWSRIPDLQSGDTGSNPVHDASQPKRNAARRAAETGRKDRAAPEPVTGNQFRWGYSSVGRAPALQAEGRRFEPVYLHHPSSGPLTQWPECLPVEEEAAGSTPARTATPR